MIKLNGAARKKLKKINKTWKLFFEKDGIEPEKEEKDGLGARSWIKCKRINGKLKWNCCSKNSITKSHFNEMSFGRKGKQGV